MGRCGALEREALDSVAQQGERFHHAEAGPEHDDEEPDGEPPSRSNPDTIDHYSTLLASASAIYASTSSWSCLLRLLHQPRRVGPLHRFLAFRAPFGTDFC